jgi:hypothetical protein
MLASVRRGARIHLVATAFVAAACGASRPSGAPLAVVVAPNGAPSASATTPSHEEPSPTTTKGAHADDGEPMIAACAPDGPDAKAARAQIDDIDKKVRALAANASADPVTHDIEQLLDGPCFKIAVPPEPLAPDSGLSLKAFWNGGAKWWLDNQLDLGKTGDRWFVVASSSVHTLASDFNPTSPLLPLLCPADAALPDSTAACGRETLGWLHRARDAYARFDEARRAHAMDADADAVPPPSPNRCEKRAQADDEKHAYSNYSSCMSLAPIRVAVLPLGRFAAPKDGWLVVRGTRGHHSWCDGISAFDLASGAFYGVKMCQGMAVSAGAQPQIETKLGRVPIDAIREAALMIMLTDFAQEHSVTRTVGWAMPKDMKVHVPPDLGRTITLGANGWSSGRTVLEASWVRAGKGQARATVEWPDSDDAKHAHATELLDVAEQGFVEGCPPAKLPRMPWSALGPRTNDKTFMPDYDTRPPFTDLRDAFDALSRSACKKN